MEIEVGEYARFEDGIIKNVDCNLKKFIDEHISKSEKDKVEFLGKVKLSKNIIDLIEVEDYVNGYKILEIEEIEKSNMKVFTVFIRDDYIHECKVWKEKDIKSIVTKEQFKNIEFKVEE